MASAPTKACSGSNTISLRSNLNQLAIQVLEFLGDFRAFEAAAKQRHDPTSVRQRHYDEPIWVAQAKPIGIEGVKPAVNLVRIVLGGDENSAPVATYLAAEDQIRLIMLALP